MIFFGYVNQKWLDAHPIPAEKSQISAFSILSDQNMENLKKLLEGPDGAEDSPTILLAKAFYRAAMDESGIEAAGDVVLRPLLDTIAHLKNKDAIRSFIIGQHARGKRLVWGTAVDIDDKDSQRYAARIYQGGLGLPDRDYYLETGKRFAAIREEYKGFLTKLFRLLQMDNAESRASSVYELERKLARVSQTALEKRDSVANYNVYPIDRLGDEFYGFDWKDYFKRIGLETARDVVISQPKFIQGALALLDNIPTKTWQDYLAVRSIVPYMAALPKAYDGLYFSFYGKVLGGAKKPELRFRRAIQSCILWLPEPTGLLFVEQYFDEAAKQAINDLVGHIKAAMRIRIQKLAWMSDTTKQRALQKLDTFKSLLGYPDKWRDYAGLVIGSSYLDNVMALEKFDWQYNTRRILQPVDRTEWLMSAATINAYYWPNTNSITFPAAILQPPLFDAKGDFAANYGGIGMVIGHEITHGFDDEGSKYDQVGNLKSWWTDADRKAFETRTEQLKEQYSQYVVDGRPVNGALTLGENIGDLGGMLIALDALQNKIKETGQAELVDGLTPQQRFFMSQARIWRTNMRPEQQLRLLVSDQHSLPRLRVNGVVTNTDEFYAAFNVRAGEHLYKPPKDRVRIW
ncbi:MAG TPA: M13 family metallopeptidase [Candidatus Saccharimonadales bacterium]|jgi:putative endopeptidase|nr:M13 family metallopeptidase [Candidatus Saccharimonadales bacterium]